MSGGRSMRTPRALPRLSERSLHCGQLALLVLPRARAQQGTPLWMTASRPQSTALTQSQILAAGKLWKRLQVRSVSCRVLGLLGVDRVRLSAEMSIRTHQSVMSHLQTPGLATGSSSVPLYSCQSFFPLDCAGWGFRPRIGHACLVSTCTLTRPQCQGLALGSRIAFHGIHGYIYRPAASCPASIWWHVQ